MCSSKLSATFNILMRGLCTKMSAVRLRKRFPAKRRPYSCLKPAKGFSSRRLFSPMSNVCKWWAMGLSAVVGHWRKKLEESERSRSPLQPRNRSLHNDEEKLHFFVLLLAIRFGNNMFLCRSNNFFPLFLRCL